MQLRFFRHSFSNGVTYRMELFDCALVTDIYSDGYRRFLEIPWCWLIYRYPF